MPPASTAVAEFVRALALGWKNLAAYPPGHPALAGPVEQAHHRLGILRGPGGEVTFGVASDGLLYGDEKIDGTQAQKLAHALYSRGVAVVRFAPETEPGELEAFLRLLGTPPSEQQRPMWEELTAAGVVNINLQPVDYSSVRITDDLTVEPQQSGSASLWEDILRALLAGKDITTDARQLLSSVRSVDALALLILRHVNDAGGEGKFDPDATFGVRLMARTRVDTPDAATSRVAEAVGTHIARSSGLRRQLGVQQIVQLLRHMPDPLRQSIIRAVLQTLAADEPAAPLMREFIAPLQQDEVLSALRYLSSVTTLSSHATRLLEALAAGATATPNLPPAPPGLISELLQLFGEEDIDRFNPPDHRALLDHAGIQIPRAAQTSAIAALGDRVDTVADDAVHLSVARGLTELIGRFGDARPPTALLRRTEEIVKALVSGGEFSEALEIVQRLREIASTTQDGALQAATGESLARMAGRETMDSLVAGLLSAPPERTASIQWLIDALGAAALQSLLIALAEEQNRSRRRRLFDFVAALGPKIVPDVTRFLSDSRWYVVRNMILLLRSVNDRTSLPEIRRLAERGDLRVRLEAIKTLLSLDAGVPRTLLENTIHDPDPKMAEMAIVLAGSYGIREAVGPLTGVLKGHDLFGRRRQLRIRALKALGELGDPEALPAVERFLTGSFLPWPNRDERRAAWESLATYPVAERAPYVEKGLRSRDAVVREICRKLSAVSSQLAGAGGPES